jgi:hypothetical protein
MIFYKFSRNTLTILHQHSFSRTKSIRNFHFVIFHFVTFFNKVAKWANYYYYMELTNEFQFHVKHDFSRS